MVRSAGDRERLRRIEAELAPRAWDVVQLEPGAREPRRALAALARERGAAAALRFDPERDELELWVAGASTDDEGSLDRLPVTAGEPRVLALQVVETLRARVLALEREQAESAASELAPEARPAPPRSERSERSEPPASPQDGPPGEDQAVANAPPAQPAQPDAEPPAVPAAAAGTRPGAAERPSGSPVPGEPARASASAPVAPALALELAPAFAYSPGGLDASFAGWAGARVQLAGAWSLTGFALVPISRPELAQAEGSARVSTWLFAAALQLRLLHTPIELSLAAGLSGVVLMTSGNARAPFTEHDENAFAPAPFLGPAVHVPIAAGVRAYARAIVGASLPRLAVRFGARDAARWGGPFVAGALGVELALLGPPARP